MTRAEIDKYIADRYAAGDTLSSIAEHLKSQGVKTPKGHDWHESNVSGAIQQMKIPRRYNYGGRKTANSPDYEALQFNGPTMTRTSLSFRVTEDYHEDIDDNLPFPGAAYKGPIKGWPNL